MLRNALRLAKIGAKAGFSGEALPAAAGLVSRAGQAAGVAGRRVARVYQNPVGGFFISTVAPIPIELALFSAITGGGQQQNTSTQSAEAQGSLSSIPMGERYPTAESLGLEHLAETDPNNIHRRFVETMRLQAAQADPQVQEELRQLYYGQDGELARTATQSPTSRAANSDRFVREAMEELMAKQGNPLMDDDLGRMVADPNLIYGGGYQHSLRSGY